MPDFSAPCQSCRDGDHTSCVSVICGCIADHPGDFPAMRGFKRLKRQLHPEREAWTKGGWKL